MAWMCSAVHAVHGEHLDGSAGRVMDACVMHKPTLRCGAARIMESALPCTTVQYAVGMHIEVWLINHDDIVQQSVLERCQHACKRMQHCSDDRISTNDSMTAGAARWSQMFRRLILPRQTITSANAPTVFLCKDNFQPTGSHPRV
jgi:hypothetical protein